MSLKFLSNILGRITFTLKVKRPQKMSRNEVEKNPAQIRELFLGILTVFLLPRCFTPNCFHIIF